MTRPLYQVAIIADAIAGFRVNRYSRKVFLERVDAEAYAPAFIEMLKDPKLFDAIDEVIETRIIELELQDAKRKDETG